MKQVKVGDEILLRCRVCRILGDGDVEVRDINGVFCIYHKPEDVIAVLSYNEDEVSKINRAMEKGISEACAANKAIIETVTAQMNQLTKSLMEMQIDEAERLRDVKENR